MQISNISILSTILISLINLFTPFASKDSFVRNFLNITISVFFFFNIIIIDWLFLSGFRTNLHIISFGIYSIDLYIDSIGLIFLNLLGFLWPCALMYTVKYLEINKFDNHSKFLFFFNLCVILGILIALSANLFSMFIFYEMLTLCTAPLIVYDKTRISEQGLYKYLKILLISSISLFLPAVITIYTKIGNGNFVNQGILAAWFSDKSSIILFLMFIFGINKAALFPLHGWLPNAMVASYPVSALLHAVLVVKVGLLCIFKVILYTFGLKYLNSLFANQSWIFIFPIFTIIYSSIKALRVNNIKMILAYSTINHLSIALLSSFMFTPKAIAAALLHMISHSFSKICLFYTAGNMYSLKKCFNLSDFTSINKTMPKSSLIFLISSISLIGIPPFAGFISKFYIMFSAALNSNYLVLIVIAFSSVLSALYMLKVLIFIYKPEINSVVIETETSTILESKLPNLMLYSTILCLVMVILFAFQALALSYFVARVLT